MSPESIADPKQGSQGAGNYPLLPRKKYGREGKKQRLGWGPLPIACPSHTQALLEGSLSAVGSGGVGLALSLERHPRRAKGEEGCRAGQGGDDTLVWGSDQWGPRASP